jgi:uncharacterized membrane protein
VTNRAPRHTATGTAKARPAEPPATVDRGIALIVAAAALWGVSDVFSKVAVASASPWLTSLVRSLVFFPIVAGWSVRRGRPRTGFDRATLAAAAAGVVVGVSIVATRFALLSYDVSIVSPIKRLGLLVTVVLGIAVLDEHLTVRKAVGIVAAVGAVVLLAP